MNKKAHEGVMSAWFILCLMFAGFGIIYILSAYASSPIDVSEVESKILYSNIVECISENGFIENEIVNENFNIYSFCNLNKDVLDEEEKARFYFKFSFLNESGEKIRRDVVGGNSEYRLDCEVFAVSKEKEYLSCLFKNESFSYVDTNGVKIIKVVGLVGVKDEI